MAALCPHIQQIVQISTTKVLKIWISITGQPDATQLKSDNDYWFIDHWRKSTLFYSFVLGVFLPFCVCSPPPTSWFVISSRISIATKSYSIAHPCKVVFKEGGELKFKLLTCETYDFKTIEWNNLTWTSVQNQLIFFKFWKKM